MKTYAFDTGGQIQPWIDREWQLTNGTGAFAASTVVGCNTRRYHGLLNATILPPVGRIATVARIGEIVRIGNDPAMRELSINAFAGGKFHPRGDQYLRRFELDHTARWHFDVDGVQIRKELQVLWKHNVSLLRYTIDPPKTSSAGFTRVSLELLPFVALRDFHSLRRGRSNTIATRVSKNGCEVLDGSLTAFLHCDAGSFEPGEDWWFDHVLPIETERGQDDHEDLFVPGRWKIAVDRPTTIQITISLAPCEECDFDRELARRKAALPPLRGASETAQRLVDSAADFIVARKKPDGTDGVTVIAGYPWFADWGRDTMISLPGLFLCTGRYKDAASVLGVFAEYISMGMIPNRFNDYTNEPEYNTVDASLWFIHACFEYRNSSKDDQTFRDVLLPACRKIVTGYQHGARYGIKMDPADGLVNQGDESTQLTWMDAKCDGVAFTPRQGKPVEINALWYHALCLMQEFDPGLASLVDLIRESFARKFFIDDKHGCYDVVSDHTADASIRPNQIFAVSLPNSPLTPQQQRAVVEVVRRELLTPAGLRTLAPGDAKFCPTFTGHARQRDAAYHNGTIWPWPIGHFLNAYLKVNDRSKGSVAQAREWLAPLLHHFANEACIGSISEVFEAATLRPAGCYAQAWSVAEVLRLAITLGI